MKKSQEHTYICEQCNLELKSLCTTKHKYTGLNCAKVEKLYFTHIKTDKDCLNKFYENLKNWNIDLLKNGNRFQIRFTGKKTSSFRPPDWEINRLRKKHKIIIDKELNER